MLTLDRLTEVAMDAASVVCVLVIVGYYGANRELHTPQAEPKLEGEIR